MFNKYPYSDVHELNLDWVLSELRKMHETIKDWINYTEIKFADPITWDKSNHYEANTIVSTNDGFSYLSKKEVPAGIDINNLDYWFKIADINPRIEEVARTTIKTYDTVSDLIKAELHAGDCVRTKGYYEINDGGECHYIIRERYENESNNAVDGTTSETGTILLKNDLVAVINEPEIFLMMFGAHKSTTVHSNIEMQNAVNYCTNYGFTLYINRGTYYLTNTIQLKAHSHISGVCGKSTFQGGSVPYIYGDIVNNQPMFNCDPVDTSYYTEGAKYVYEDILIENLSLNGKATSFCAITARTTLSNFRNLAIERFKVGFWTASSYKTYIHNVVCAICEISFYLASGTNQNTVFDKCWASYSQTVLTIPELSPIIKEVLTACKSDYACGVYIGDTSAGTFHDMSTEAVYYGFYVTTNSKLLVNNCGIESIPINGSGISLNDVSICKAENMTFYNPENYGGKICNVSYHSKLFLNSIYDKPSRFADPVCDRNAMLILDFANYNWYPTVTVTGPVNPNVVINHCRFTEHNSIEVELRVTYTSWSGDQPFTITGLPTQHSSDYVYGLEFVDSYGDSYGWNISNGIIMKSGAWGAPKSNAILRFSYTLAF